MSDHTSNEPSVNLELALEHGLTQEEYEMIVQCLGRTPSFTELGVYSVMWSEHCSYKNSIIELKNSRVRASIYWLKQAKKMPDWLILVMVWVVRSK